MPASPGSQPKAPMQDHQIQNAVQATMQPFIKLVQANMALLTKFSVPPDVAPMPAAARTEIRGEGRAREFSWRPNARQRRQRRLPNTSG